MVPGVISLSGVEKGLVGHTFGSEAFALGPIRWSNLAVFFGSLRLFGLINRDPYAEFPVATSSLGYFPA